MHNAAGAQRPRGSRHLARILTAGAGARVGVVGPHDQAVGRLQVCCRDGDNRDAK